MSAFLSYIGPEVRQMDGVGLFGPDLPAIAVSESVAAQYNTVEMQALGWHVHYQDDQPELNAES